MSNRLQRLQVAINEQTFTELLSNRKFHWVAMFNVVDKPEWHSVIETEDETYHLFDIKPKYSQEEKIAWCGYIPIMLPVESYAALKDYLKDRRHAIIETEKSGKVTKDIKIDDMFGADEEFQFLLEAEEVKTA